MKKLFFLYVWLNLTRPECFRDKENLVKHMRKRTIQTGRLFSSSSLSIFTAIIMLALLGYISSPVALIGSGSNPLIWEDEENSLPEN